MMKSVYCTQKVIILEIMINNKVDKVIEKLFQSFLFKYQNELEKSMKGSNFIFHCVHLSYYK